VTLKYKILKDHALVYMHISGEISLARFKLAGEEIWNNPDYFREVDVLVNLTESRWKTNFSELSGLIKLLTSHPKSATGKMGVVVNSPLLTAIAGIFANRMLVHQKVQVFSTEQAACNYLNTSFETIHNPEHSYTILIK
jgi:hypothetical protein